MDGPPPESPANADLLRSLGRLVRGLSALFWGLPLALVVCFHTAKADAFKTFGVIPPLVATGLLVFGLWQIGDFQKQERIWRNTLERARMLSIALFGLSPFLFWWNRMPGNLFYTIITLLVGILGLLLLSSLNLVLRRLGAMLPDEGLRLEIKQFTALNLNLLAAIFIVAGVFIAAGFLRTVPLWLGVVLAMFGRASSWLLIMLLLLPLAMTMALIWKTKEVILDSVFNAPR